MKYFIEVTTSSQGLKQLINLNNVNSFTELSSKTVILFNKNTTITVIESYEEIKQLIKQATEL